MFETNRLTITILQPGGAAKTILSDFDLTVADGEFLTTVGPSG